MTKYKLVIVVRSTRDQEMPIPLEPPTEDDFRAAIQRVSHLALTVQVAAFNTYTYVPTRQKTCNLESLVSKYYVKLPSSYFKS